MNIRKKLKEDFGIKPLIDRYNFIDNSLSFTPNDCATLWETIEEVFEDEEEIIENMSPDEYFTENKLLTLDDCSTYEKFLKQFLVDNKNKPRYTDMTKAVLNDIKINTITNNKENIIDFTF